jgi:hypothetical protein
MLTLMLDGHRETCETCTQILEEANVGVFHGDEEKLKMDLSGKPFIFFPTSIKLTLFFQ